MAVDAPRGFQLYYGKNDPEDFMECYIPSTDSTIVGLGDAVVLAGSYAGDGAPAPDRPTVQRASAGAGNAIFGIVMNIKQHMVSDSNHSLDRKHRPASVGMYVDIRPVKMDDVFVIQADGAVAKTSVGQVGNLLTLVDADTTTGYSKMELDASTLATSATTNQLLLVGFPENANVEYNTANQQVLVRVNNIQGFHAFGGV